MRTKSGRSAFTKVTATLVAGPVVHLRCLACGHIHLFEKLKVQNGLRVDCPCGEHVLLSATDMATLEKPREDPSLWMFGR